VSATLAWSTAEVATVMESGDGVRANGRRGLATLTAALLALAACGDDAERAPSVGDAEDTVTAFFEAQAAGDCEALLDILSETTWSDSGRLDRDGFRALCPEVVARHGNRFDGFLTAGDEAVGDGTALVAVSLTIQGDETVGSRPYVRLVVENGQWRVEPREAVQLGRSPWIVLEDHLAALAAGDCEGVLATLSEATWSAEGSRSREEFLASCEDALGQPGSYNPGIVVAGGGQFVPDEQATTVAGRDSLRLPVTVGPSEALDTLDIFEDQEVTFVQEGLEPRIHSPGEPPFPALGSVELARQVPEALGPLPVAPVWSAVRHRPLAAQAHAEEVFWSDLAGHRHGHGLVPELPGQQRNEETEPDGNDAFEDLPLTRAHGLGEEFRSDVTVTTRHIGQ
jgi:hypothetical protein